MKFSVFEYLKQVLAYPRRTGAIAPSCEEISDLITDTAQLDKAKTVIELGPGTGVFTEKILDKISSDTVFFALEINPKFVEATKERCPDAIVYNDSAENARLYLEKHGKESCDCIISALPWAAFGSDLQDKLLHTIYDVLKPGGKLLTLAYVHGLAFPTAQRFRSKLHSMFPYVIKTRTVWSNLPPGFVYCAKKK